jgi:DNA-binding transcriptional ArsR family regulator
MVDQNTQLDALFKALSDPTRRAMVDALSTGPKPISALAEPHAMTLAGASKHVGVLEKAGLSTRRRVGRTQQIALAPQGLKIAANWLAAYSAFWSARLDTLEAALAEESQDDGAQEERT